MARFTEGVESIPHITERAKTGGPALPLKYEFSRPFFLELTKEQFDTSKDHGQRLVLTPSNYNKMPWHSGYAEAINSGKSIYVNEDQASVHVSALSFHDSDKDVSITLPYVMFGIFDGHAGTGAATMATHNLHKHVKEKLNGIKHFLVQDSAQVIAEDDPGLGCITEPIPKELLVMGMLEEAFVEMDEQIRAERNTFLIKGGCTAIVALFLQNKVYIANAGDCRAILLLEHCSVIHPLSTDFTPETDRQRLQKLAYLQPQLLGRYFGRLEYQRRLRKKDIGQRVLYRDRHMTGWAYRTVNEEDVNQVPMIIGHGKRARLMATIGTTRGFGDHDLEAPGGQFIKPLLTPVPEVRVWNLDSHTHNDDDMLIIASDGLWERLTNEEAQEIVKELAETLPHDDKYYTNVARELVLAARGQFGKKGWRTAKEQSASCDDISCFVIPLHTYTTSPSPGCLGEEDIIGGDSIDPVRYGSGADFVDLQQQ